MTPEHEHLERLAAAHDAKAADLEAAANRRAAEIIRHQIECEA